jgi:hypothetical protein
MLIFLLLFLWMLLLFVLIGFFVPIVVLELKQETNRVNQAIDTSCAIPKPTGWQQASAKVFSYWVAWPHDRTCGSYIVGRGTMSNLQDIRVMT